MITNVVVALRVEELHKAFDGNRALDGLSLTADHALSQGMPQ